MLRLNNIQDKLFTIKISINNLIYVDLMFVYFLCSSITLIAG